MKESRFSNNQILAILKQAETGVQVSVMVKLLYRVDE